MTTTHDDDELTITEATKEYMAHRMAQLRLDPGSLHPFEMQALFNAYQEELLSAIKRGALPSVCREQGRCRADCPDREVLGCPKEEKGKIQ
jgi:hypothetical protein